MSEIMTEVIASRPMIRTRADGSTCTVEICFGKPAFVSTVDNQEEGDYYCPIQLIGFENDEIYAAYGVDSVNALVLALVMVPTLLQLSPIGKELDFAAAPNFAFPILPPDPIVPPA